MALPNSLRRFPRLAEKMNTSIRSSPHVTGKMDISSLNEKMNTIFRDRSKRIPAITAQTTPQTSFELVMNTTNNIEELSDRYMRRLGNIYDVTDSLFLVRKYYRKSI